MRRIKVRYIKISLLVLLKDNLYFHVLKYIQATFEFIKLKALFSVSISIKLDHELEVTFHTVAFKL